MISEVRNCQGFPYHRTFIFRQTQTKQNADDETPGLKQLCHSFSRFQKGYTDALKNLTKILGKIWKRIHNGQDDKCEVLWGIQITHVDTVSSNLLWVALAFILLKNHTCCEWLCWGRFRAK